MRKIFSALLLATLVTTPALFSMPALGADPGKFRATKEGDLSIIRIGKERYEIPDAVVFGG